MEGDAGDVLGKPPEEGRKKDTYGPRFEKAIAEVLDSTGCGLVERPDSYEVGSGVWYLRY